MRMSQIMTMDHGSGSWSKSQISDHDHGPDHDLLDHGPMSSHLWEILEKSRDFSTSNRSKPIRVLTRTKCSCSDDRLPIGYLLPDFQQVCSKILTRFGS